MSMSSNCSSLDLGWHSLILCLGGSIALALPTWEDAVVWQCTSLGRQEDDQGQEAMSVTVSLSLGIRCVSSCYFTMKYPRLRTATSFRQTRFQILVPKLLRLLLVIIMIMKMNEQGLIKTTWKLIRRFNRSQYFYQGCRFEDYQDENYYVWG